MPSIGVARPLVTVQCGCGRETSYKIERVCGPATPCAGCLEPVDGSERTISGGYIMCVSCRDRCGACLPRDQGQWDFTRRSVEPWRKLGWKVPAGARRKALSREDAVRRESGDRRIVVEAASRMPLSGSDASDYLGALCRLSGQISGAA